MKLWNQTILQTNKRTYKVQASKLTSNKKERKITVCVCVRPQEAVADWKLKSRSKSTPGGSYEQIFEKSDQRDKLRSRFRKTIWGPVKSFQVLTNPFASELIPTDECSPKACFQVHPGPMFVPESRQCNCHVQLSTSLCPSRGNATSSPNGMWPGSEIEPQTVEVGMSIPHHSAAARHNRRSSL